MKRMIRVAATLAAAFACIVTAQARNFPDRAINLYVPSGPGSAPDIMARVVGDALAKSIGQPVIVENKPGAGGILMMNSLKAAKPDGYTIGLAQAAVATVTPLTYKAATYDIERDFETVGTVGMTPMIFTASPEFPARTLAEAIAMAKANPEDVSIGNPRRTSIPHLANELLASKASAKFLQVPFSATTQGIQAVIGGDVKLYTDGVAPLIALIKSGKLKALAVAADRTLPGLEGIPLAQETVPGLVVYGWFTIHAPKGTPTPILQRLNAELNEALKRPEVIERFHSLGTYTQISTLAESAAYVQEQKELFGGVVKAMGLRPE